MRVAIVTTGLLVLGAELFVRYGLDRYDTYNERNGAFKYESPYLKPIPTWVFTHEPNRRLHDELAEFVHSREVGSLGLSERKIPAEKSPGDRRYGHSLSRLLHASPINWIEGD